MDVEFNISLYDCHSVCNTTGNCNWISYNKLERGCLLFSYCRTRNNAHHNYVSRHVNCPNEKEDSLELGKYLLSITYPIFMYADVYKYNYLSKT